MRAFRSRRRFQRRGQALVISALVMLFVAVAVMVTFAIGHRTREKIKLQAVADAGAYSLAVAGARTFNYFAFSNRAHVAHDVSILSVHSHNSFLSWYDHQLIAQSKAHRYSGYEMLGYCVPCAVSGVCCKSCSSAGKAFKVAKFYNDVHKRFHKDYFDTYDRILSMGSQGHYYAITMIGMSQRLMLADLLMKAGSQQFAEDIGQVMDRDIKAAGMGGVKAANNINSAVGFDPETAEDWLEINAATRWPSWLTRRGLNGAAVHWFAKWAEAQGKAGSCFIVPIPPSNSGSSQIVSSVGELYGHSSLKSAIDRGGDNRTGWSGHANGGGHAFGAYDEGRAFSMWICDCPTFGTSSAKGAVYSDPNTQGGGKTHKHGFHLKDGSPERGSKTASLHGLGGCDSKGNCGIYQGHMRYKLSTEQKQGEDFLWNWPHTVAFVTKDMRVNNALPWNFNFRADIPVPVQFSTVNRPGDDAMAAVAGGLVYYHKPTRDLGRSRIADGWREPPSLWNPFWRAKLHPLRSSDAMSALAGHPSRNVLLRTGFRGINY